MKKTTLYILLCATMLCYTGVTKAEAPAQTVSKTDAPKWNQFQSYKVTPVTYNFDATPVFAFVQGDIYYSDTIVYCDFEEECIEDVYLEPDSPVPLIASMFSDIPFEVGWC